MEGRKRRRRKKKEKKRKKHEEEGEKEKRREGERKDRLSFESGKSLQPKHFILLVLFV